MRVTHIGREVRAGCFNCYGSELKWNGKNAQGVAAKHHDATGHETWVEVFMNIRYGGSDSKKKEK